MTWWNPGTGRFPLPSVSCCFDDKACNFRNRWIPLNPLLFLLASCLIFCSMKLFETYKSSVLMWEDVYHFHIHSHKDVSPSWPHMKECYLSLVPTFLPRLCIALLSAPLSCTENQAAVSVGRDRWLRRWGNAGCGLEKWDSASPQSCSYLASPFRYPQTEKG